MEQIYKCCQQYRSDPALMFDSTKPNYNAWLVRVKAELAVFDLLDVALGNAPRGEADPQIHNLKAAFAKKVLLSTLDDPVVEQVGEKSAAEIMRYMDVTYVNRHPFEAFRMFEEFTKLKYVEGTDIVLHANKLHLLASDLTRRGHSIDDKMKACQLLASLPDSLDHVRRACLDMVVFDWETV
ncbi:hypothetical protein Poli38472_002963 [Pythium oligandrum]|uniref:Uncharacterized protein n=1 Tax=Pythium oligandrum TaxID=41045 RepID=A0A8K1C682_PYTOL|nr:hypothetical protein Poli38472_002963 [Pythium oligandrum]|eukprot:TMW57038.1 hypothetical protein Poli38472_002963 [Pythium oligandrum]